VRYSHRKTAELLAKAKVMRTEEQLSWPEIAGRLGVELGWLNWQKGKIEDFPKGRIVEIPKDDMDETLAKIKAMRDQKMTWKTIGKTLGRDWIKLYSAYRYNTEGSVRK
jgi:hypothetical protein